MTTIRFLLAALALACLTSTGSLAQITKKNTGTGGAEAEKGTGDTGKTGARMGVWGRIVKVDTAKRTLVLGDVVRAGTGKSTTGTGGSDKGGTGGDKGTGATGSDKSGTGTGGNKQVTFMVAESAKITLDGKEATLSDLKDGYFARVHMQKSGSAGKGGTGGSDKGATGGDKGKAGTGAADDKGGTGAGDDRTRTAHRVEAFTKRPADFGTFGTGTGGKGGTGGARSKDRD